MAKDLTGAVQSAVGLTARVPEAGDQSSAARFEAIIQTLLNNDATINNKVTGQQLADALDTLTGWVRTREIANAAINAEKLSATGGASGAFLKHGGGNALTWATAVQHDEIASDAVRTAAIQNGAVTLAKLASNSVDASKIVNDSVGNAELANNAVQEAQLSDGSVTEAKLDISNAPTAGQFLQYKDSTDELTWAAGGQPTVTSGAWNDHVAVDRQNGNGPLSIRGSFIKSGKLVYSGGRIEGAARSNRRVSHPPDMLWDSSSMPAGALATSPTYSFGVITAGRGTEGSNVHGGSIFTVGHRTGPAPRIQIRVTNVRAAFEADFIFIYLEP